jgi:hypothetical protein
MVIFKKPSKAVPAPSSQTPLSLDKTIIKSLTANSSKQHASANKASAAPIRYSDIAAGRDARENGTPIEKLINTFELCEQVLEYLPMKEVLLAMRVCRAFKTNIENSSRLQAKLFLALDLTIRRKAVSTAGTLLSGVKAEQHIAAAKAAGHSSSGEIALYQPHPGTRSKYLSVRYRSMGMVKYAAVCVESHHKQHDAILTFHDSVVSIPKTSSLHRMLLCQPPATEVRAYFPGAVARTPVTIRKEAGVTFGDVICAKRNLEVRKVDVVLCGGFVASSEARDAMERAGEMSVDDDPTRWVGEGDDVGRPLGGFSFD